MHVSRKKLAVVAGRQRSDGLVTFCLDLMQNNFAKHSLVSGSQKCIDFWGWRDGLALPEDTGSVSSVHKAVHNCLIPAPGDPTF